MIIKMLIIMFILIDTFNILYAMIHSLFLLDLLCVNNG